MKTKTIVGATVVVLFSLFAIAGFSQRTPAQTNSTDSTAGQTMRGYMGGNGMMSGGMMGSGMMYGRMGRYMMGNYHAAQKLINRLESDVSAAKAEASSAAIKSKLADAASAITQLKQEYSENWGMMNSMPMYANHCYWTQPQQKQN